MTTPLPPPPPVPHRFRHPQAAAKVAVEDAAIAAYVAGKRAAEAALRLPEQQIPTPTPAAMPAAPPALPSAQPAGMPPPLAGGPPVVPPAAGQPFAPPPNVIGTINYPAAPPTTQQPAVMGASGMVMPGQPEQEYDLLPGVISADEMFNFIISGDAQRELSVPQYAAGGIVPEFDKEGGAVSGGNFGPLDLPPRDNTAFSPRDSQKELGDDEVSALSEGPEPPEAFVQFITAPEALDHTDEFIGDVAALVADGVLNVKEAYNLVLAIANDDDGVPDDVLETLYDTNSTALDTTEQMAAMEQRNRMPEMGSMMRNMGDVGMARGGKTVLPPPPPPSRRAPPPPPPPRGR